jgi:hypothetical protein
MAQPNSYTWNVVPETTPPVLQIARAVDARVLEVVFSEDVNQSEAMNPLNYVITGAGGLAVNSVSKLSASIYRLNTARQTVGASYNVTASNIHDLAGNLI